MNTSSQVGFLGKRKTCICQDAFICKTSLVLICKLFRCRTKCSGTMWIGSEHVSAEKSSKGSNPVVHVSIKSFPT